MKKRIGNDIEQTVSVTVGDVAIDLNAVDDLEIKLGNRRSRNTQEISTFEIVAGSALMYLEKKILTELGKYYYLITFKISDSNFDDGYQNFTIDVDAFEVVARTAEEDDSDQQITVAAVAGLKGNGIESIVWTDTTGLVKTYTITFTDGTTTTFDVSDGADGHSPVITFVGTTIFVDGVEGADLKGDTGNGVSSLELISTVDLTRTYRFTFTNGSTFDFSITDGIDGIDGASAYEIYLDETTDDPPMTISEWGNLMTGILNVLNSI